MTFKLPIQVPEAGAIQITQGFGPTTNTLEPKGPNGEEHFHYGLDIVCGDDHATFGAMLRCPFPSGHLINEFPQQEGSPTTPLIQLQFNDADGTRYDAILAHCSQMQPVGLYAEGDPVGKIGNIGLVSPRPSLKDPYAGAHLHLGLQVNGAWVDPQEYFDCTDPFLGAAPTPDDQLPATDWLIQQLEAFIHSITGHNF